MNHKRKRPINRRSGCKLCKPHKINHPKHKGLKDKDYIEEKRIIKEVKGFYDE